MNEIARKLKLPALDEPWGGTPIILMEYFDPELLDFIIKNREKLKVQLRTKNRDKDDVFSWTIKYFKENPNGARKTSYDYLERYRKAKLGRVFSNGIAMQNMLREVRSTINYGIYDDIDMVNSHPRILNWICRKLKIHTYYLRMYIFNHKKRQQDVHKKYGIPLPECKILFIELLQGIAVKTKIEGFEKNFKNEIDDISIKITEKMPETKKMLDKNFNSSRINHEVMRLVIHTAENHILMAMCKFFKDKGVLKDEGVLMYDGILIPKNSKTIDLLHPCELFLRENFDFPNIQLTYKQPLDKFDLNNV